ncbi:hypothetical protein PJIAN_4774 [Paludibacter jiangxiensis]|uniref:Uncharacterized protein n=1 Tax=Paludibacter jiangxiensis TaxID=681398 RepID=A0A161L9L9_9BACT|nr:hypothetical protein PJIAN_4774 [Paludibacter jiangxiensis]
MKKNTIESLQYLSVPIVILTIIALIFCKQFERIKYFEIVRICLIVLLLGSLVINLSGLFKRK